MPAECVVVYNRHSGREYQRQLKTNKESTLAQVVVHARETWTCLTACLFWQPRILKQWHTVILGSLPLSCRLFDYSLLVIPASVIPDEHLSEESSGREGRLTSRHVSWCCLWARPLSSFPGVLSYSGKLEQLPEGSSGSCSKGRGSCKAHWGLAMETTSSQVCHWSTTDQEKT